METDKLPFIERVLKSLAKKIKSGQTTSSNPQKKKSLPHCSPADTPMQSSDEEEVQAHLSEEEHMSDSDEDIVPMSAAQKKRQEMAAQLQARRQEQEKRKAQQADKESEGTPLVKKSRIDKEKMSKAAEIARQERLKELAEQTKYEEALSRKGKNIVKDAMCRHLPHKESRGEAAKAGATARSEETVQEHNVRKEIQSKKNAERRAAVARALMESRFDAQEGEETPVQADTIDLRTAREIEQEAQASMQKQLQQEEKEQLLMRGLEQILRKSVHELEEERRRKAGDKQHSSPPPSPIQMPEPHVSPVPESPSRFLTTPPMSPMPLLPSPTFKEQVGLNTNQEEEVVPTTAVTLPQVPVEKPTQDKGKQSMVIPGIVLETCAAEESLSELKTFRRTKPHQVVVTGESQGEVNQEHRATRLIKSIQKQLDQLTDVTEFEAKDKAYYKQKLEEALDEKNKLEERCHKYDHEIEYAEGRVQEYQTQVFSLQNELQHKDNDFLRAVQMQSVVTTENSKLKLTLNMAYERRMQNLLEDIW